MENRIRLKALVDKRSNKIIFIESGNAFIDVLLSFLTIPLGSIIKLGREHSAQVEIGCMNNLYSSVEEIDVCELRSDACREMLLLPRNAAESHCKNLVLQIYHNAKPTRYLACWYCLKNSTRKFFNYYRGDIAPCGVCKRYTCQEITFSVDGSSAFVKERARLLITDDLQLISPCCTSIVSLFTNLGVNRTEELNLNIGIDEVMSLLISSLVSKTPLSETLLKHKPGATDQ
ncbi:uncharacterized protein [Pyrus communis]|uniref:uncharacterized protein n=1 Tax=Pyrus communis TaxID=23211 RepID=UPI0035C0202F